jgi:hypothetical protein
MLAGRREWVTGAEEILGQPGNDGVDFQAFNTQEEREGEGEARHAHTHFSSLVDGADAV